MTPAGLKSNQGLARLASGVTTFCRATTRTQVCLEIALFYRRGPTCQDMHRDFLDERRVMKNQRFACALPSTRIPGVPPYLPLLIEGIVTHASDPPGTQSS
jgi:hypothetical protein